MAGMRFRLPGAARNSNCRRRRDTPDARRSRAGLQQRLRRERYSAAAGLDFDVQSGGGGPPGLQSGALGDHASMRRFITRFANSIRQTSSRSGRDASRHEIRAVYRALGQPGRRLGSHRPRHIQWRGRQRDGRRRFTGARAILRAHQRRPPIARLYFWPRPRRSPICSGSQYYVENPVFPLRETAAVINVETLIDGGPTRDVSIVGFGNTDLEDTARADALLQGRETRPEPNPQSGGISARTAIALLITACR